MRDMAHSRWPSAGLRRTPTTGCGAEGVGAAGIRTVPGPAEVAPVGVRQRSAFRAGEFTSVGMSGDMGEELPGKEGAPDRRRSGRWGAYMPARVPLTG